MRFLAVLVFVLAFLSSCASSDLGSKIKWGDNRLIAGTDRFRVELSTSGELAKPPIEGDVANSVEGTTVHYYGLNEVDLDPTKDHVLGYNVFGFSLPEYSATQFSAFHRSNGHKGELFGGVRYVDLIWTEDFRLRWLDLGISDDSIFVNTRLAFKAGDSTFEPSFELLQNWEDGETPVYGELNWFAPNWLGKDTIRPFVGGGMRFDDIGESFSDRSTYANVGIAASF